MAGTEHIRTCISCRRKERKERLVRVVRMPDGTVRLDPSSKLPGRGAYVCGLECLEEACSKRRLASALRTNVTSDQASALVLELKQL